MEDPDSIQSMSDTTSLLPAVVTSELSHSISPIIRGSSERPQRPAIRRIRNTSIRLSHTEPTSLIVRNRDTISTGKSFSEALILASTNPQYDKRLFIDLPVQYMKTTSSEQVVYINSCFVFGFFLKSPTDKSLSEALILASNFHELNL